MSLLYLTVPHNEIIEVLRVYIFRISAYVFLGYYFLLQTDQFSIYVVDTHLLTFSKLACLMKFYLL